MIKFTFPVDAGNDEIRSRKVEKVFKQIAEELKPEAEYVFPQCGERGGLFFGLNAKVEMVPEDEGKYQFELEDARQPLLGFCGRDTAKQQRKKAVRLSGPAILVYDHTDPLRLRS